MNIIKIQLLLTMMIMLVLLIPANNFSTTTLLKQTNYVHIGTSDDTHSNSFYLKVYPEKYKLINTCWHLSSVSHDIIEIKTQK